MPLHYLQSLTSRTRSERANTHLGVILALTAGAVNVIGLMALGSYTAHMTGITSDMAQAMAENQPNIVVQGSFFIGTFICGAILSTIIINGARDRKFKSEYVPAIMLEALLLCVLALEMDLFVLSSNAEHAVVTIAIMRFAMGLHNAIITRISNAVIRTTHITGMVTDLGIEQGRYIYRVISGIRLMKLYPDKLALHGLLFGAFILGGVIGAFLYLKIGMLCLLPFGFILLVLSAIPMAMSVTD